MLHVNQVVPKDDKAEKSLVTSAAFVGHVDQYSVLRPPIQCVVVSPKRT